MPPIVDSKYGVHPFFLITENEAVLIRHKNLKIALRHHSQIRYRGFTYEETNGRNHNRNFNGSCIGAKFNFSKETEMILV